MRLLIVLCLFAAPLFAADPKLNPGEKIVGNDVLVPDRDGSIYHVPKSDEALLEAIRAKVTGKSPCATCDSCPCPTSVCATGSCGALDEVNATRARHGLPAFRFDAQLTIAAQKCAECRAASLTAGHTKNDFAFVPAGASAKAAGCAAWHPAQGWGACCTFEAWTHAGAAFAIGRDGKRYMQLFVR